MVREKGVQETRYGRGILSETETGRGVGREDGYLISGKHVGGVQGGTDTREEYRGGRWFWH